MNSSAVVYPTLAKIHQFSSGKYAANTLLLLETYFVSQKSY